jgi:hypothetical protein
MYQTLTHIDLGSNNNLILEFRIRNHHADYK